MRNIPKLALWLVFSALVMGAGVFPANAGFYHPRGLMMSTYPQQMLVFWTAKDQSAQLIVIIEPPWYFVQDLNTFQNVTLTVTLKPTGLLRGPRDYLSKPMEPMMLSGGVNSNGVSIVTFHWTNVAMSQNGDGAVLDAYLLCTITFAISSNTATGFYLLILSAQATAGDVLFAGWDQIGVSLRPPGYIPDGYTLEP